MIDEGLGKKKLATQRLRHVNDLRRRGERKVLVYQNVVRSPGASVECFVKVHVHEICDALAPRLWRQKAPTWFLFVNPALRPLESERRFLRVTALMPAVVLRLP